MKVKSTSEVLKYLYGLSLNKSNYRFRGQSDMSWELKPSIYRYSDFLRYQTVFYEKEVLKAKPIKANPPLTQTNFDMEWLMVCQHYGIPTRLIDWTTDILSALFFACYDKEQLSKDGAIYICNQEDYPLFSKYSDSISENIELAFVSTHVINPRMRNQSGCFMMWGRRASENTTETYNLKEYQQEKEGSFFLKKIIIPSELKTNMLKELKEYYSITPNSVYIENSYLEKEFGSSFLSLKETARKLTLHVTDAEKLSKAENDEIIKMSGIDRTNMFKMCVNIGNEL